VDMKSKNITFLSQSLLFNINENVEFLYLNNNNIKVIPDELFINFPNLIWLDLRCNKIRKIPRSIEQHQSLQVLLLGKNNLKELPNTLGSISKLKELNVSGNPIEYPSRDILKKGSKYLIKYLQEQWFNETNQSYCAFNNNLEENIKIKDISTSAPYMFKKQNKKIQGGIFNKARLMERYSWPMIFLTNWSSDRLVTDRDVRLKELERLYKDKRKTLLEKQERCLQSFKNKELLKGWRYKARQLQLIESDSKYQNYTGLEAPFGLDKKNLKTISRKMYNKEINETLKNTNTPITFPKKFDFDLEMSNIYQLLTNINTNMIGYDSQNDNKDRVLMSKVEIETQMLQDIQKRIANLKSCVIK
ncbi:uncharacterized protein LOC126900184, partial [Daktulosphaira vitifoliae]|uniref:uncharacterized protein LOC126900184 n=1 Tax=Daktulosphaira vitifoliae TaxID=58002 RepID=UPI0021A9C2A2